MEEVQEIQRLYVTIQEHIFTDKHWITPSNSIPFSSIPLHLGLDVLDLIERNEANIATKGGMGRDLIKAPSGAFHLQQKKRREDEWNEEGKEMGTVSSAGVHNLFESYYSDNCRLHFMDTVEEGRRDAGTEGGKKS